MKTTGKTDLAHAILGLVIACGLGATPMAASAQTADPAKLRCTASMVSSMATVEDFCSCKIVTTGTIRAIQRRPDFPNILAATNARCPALAIVLSDVATQATPMRENDLKTTSTERAPRGSAMPRAAHRPEAAPAREQVAAIPGQPGIPTPVTLGTATVRARARARAAARARGAARAVAMVAATETVRARGMPEARVEAVAAMRARKGIRAAATVMAMAKTWRETACPVTSPPNRARSCRCRASGSPPRRGATPGVMPRGAAQTPADQPAANTAIQRSGASGFWTRRNV